MGVKEGVHEGVVVLRVKSMKLYNTLLFKYGINDTVRSLIITLGVIVVNYMLKQLAYWGVIQVDPYEEAIVRVSRWLEPGQVETLLDAINVPYFLPEYDEFRPEKTVDDQQDFNYQELQSEDSIRLLEILPSLAPDTPIRCCLLTATSGSAQPYAALSYAWGPDDLETEIYVAGSSVLISNRSQAKFLSIIRSRREDSNITVWINYLCVDQYDYHEINSEVCLMGRIFRQAREVIVGTETVDDNASAERGLEHLVNLAINVGDLARESVNENNRRRIGNFVRDIGQNNEWPLVTIPFKSRWWTRVWFAQEIVCASNAVIFLGSRSVPFSIVEKALQALSFMKDDLEGLGAPISELTLEPGWLAAEGIVQSRQELRARGKLELPILLWRFRRSGCTDPRDRIYAYLTLCDYVGLEIDYELSCKRVFLDVSRCIMRREESYKVLSLRSTFASVEKTNSWAPDYGRTGLTARLPLYLGVFDPQYDKHLYCASGQFQSPHIVTNSEAGPDTLAVNGWMVDAIESVSDEAMKMETVQALRQMRDIVRQYQEAIGIDSRAPDAVGSRWRILLGNQFPLGQKLDHLTRNGMRIPPSNIEDEEHLLVHGESIPTKLLIGRRVMVTHGGRIGLAPEEAKPMDKVVILPGRVHNG